ncbi:unnamed protein product [Sphagnum troendelagicum]|uniref:Uncharacterized protein n=1 Tax=Sphagnum troendelagicum TaxID=128251 RepID=A0ABP0TGG4_9BRYO
MSISTIRCAYYSTFSFFFRVPVSRCKVHTAWSAAWSNLNMKSEEMDVSCGGKGDRKLFREREDHGKHIQVFAALMENIRL